MEPLFQQILVATDGSEPSLKAVETALRIAEACPSQKMTLLYVVDKLVVRELVRFGKHSENEVEAELEEQGRRHLESARKDAERRGVATQCLTQKGDPFEEVVATANELSADLIVMGHTGRRGTDRVLIGSVTQRVLDYASCPVLVVK